METTENNRIEKPQLIITFADLAERPCRRYDYLEGQRFDAIKEIEKNEMIFMDMDWLLINCPKAQTREIFQYYISINPDYRTVSWLIINCPAAQTPEMFGYYVSKNPDYRNIRSLIINCKKAQTREMFAYYLEKKPYYKDVIRLINECPVAAKNDKVINYIKKIEK
jgi:hypothetical protein